MNEICVKLSVFELLEKFESIKKISNVPFTIKVAYRFGKLGKQVIKEIKSATERFKKNNPQEITEENIKGYNELWNEFIKNETIELVFVPFSALDIPKESTLSPVDIMNLEIFFTSDSIEKLLEEGTPVL